MATDIIQFPVDSPEPWWNQVTLRKTRIIPVLLLRGRGFVKTTKFANPTYLGDPINIVKIFNEKEVDEIVILDITATPENRSPDISMLADIAGECFMPLAYGGGVRTLADIKQITSLGFEKVCINTSFIDHPQFVREAADQFGSSTIVVSLDVKQNFFGKYEVCCNGGRRRTGLSPVEAAQRAEACGAGELLINAIHCDGTMQGYDLQLVRQVSDAISIPVVACGGAATVEHLRDAVVIGGASASAAGSMFVFHGRHRAVLINTPDSIEYERAGLP